ncbi:MAG: hypothetical protein ACTHQ3_14145 [Motilibacteraceae bacterium]
MDEGIPAELAVAAEPVLHDLAAAGLRVQLVASDWGDARQCTAMAWWPDGTGCGVRIDLDESAAERVARVADQLQEPAVEGLPALGRPAVWPECPDHPDRHPLQAACRDGMAVWTCPAGGRVVARIGELGALFSGTA